MLAVASAKLPVASNSPCPSKWIISTGDDFIIQPFSKFAKGGGPEKIYFDLSRGILLQSIHDCLRISSRIDKARATGSTLITNSKCNLILGSNVRRTPVGSAIRRRWNAWIFIEKIYPFRILKHFPREREYRQSPLRR